MPGVLTTPQKKYPCKLLSQIDTIILLLLLFQLQFRSKNLKYNQGRFPSCSNVLLSQLKSKHNMATKTLTFGNISFPRRLSGNARFISISISVTTDYFFSKCTVDFLESWVSDLLTEIFDRSEFSKY